MVRRATNLQAVKTGSESYRLPKCIKHTSDYYTCNENTIMCDLPFVLIVFVRQIAKFMLFAYFIRILLEMTQDRQTKP